MKEQLKRRGRPKKQDNKPATYTRQVITKPNLQSVIKEITRESALINLHDPKSLMKFYGEIEQNDIAYQYFNRLVFTCAYMLYWQKEMSQQELSNQPIVKFKRTEFANLTGIEAYNFERLITGTGHSNILNRLLFFFEVHGIGFGAIKLHPKLIEHVTFFMSFLKNKDIITPKIINEIFGIQEEILAELFEKDEVV